MSINATSGAGETGGSDGRLIGDAKIGPDWCWKHPPRPKPQPFDATEQEASMKAIKPEVAAQIAATIIPKLSKDHATGCWVGPNLNPVTGYSSISIQGDRFYCHRAMYTHAKGQIPPGLTIDHLCRNPGCVNPDHLEAVTHRENVLRSGNRAAINARREVCIQGHGFDYTSPSGRRHCMECQRERLARYRAEGLPDSDPRHGTTTGYNMYGCRCDPCREAKSAYRRKGVA